MKLKVDGCLHLADLLWRKHSHSQRGSQWRKQVLPYNLFLETHLSAAPTVHYFLHKNVTFSCSKWNIFRAIFLPLVSVFWQSLQETLSKRTELHLRPYLESKPVSGKPSLTSASYGNPNSPSSHQGICPGERFCTLHFSFHITDFLGDRYNQRRQRSIYAV